MAKWQIRENNGYVYVSKGPHKCSLKITTTKGDAVRKAKNVINAKGG